MTVLGGFGQPPGILREKSKRDPSTARRGSFVDEREKKKPRLSGRDDSARLPAGAGKRRADRHGL
jgi:hypothetical protein